MAWVLTLPVCVLLGAGLFAFGHAAADRNPIIPRIIQSCGAAHF